MAPPHTGQGNKSKPTKAKPTASPSMKRHAPTPAQLSKRRSDGSKATDAARGGPKHDGDTATKVGKKHKQRRGLGRGRGRGRGAKKEGQTSTSEPPKQPEAAVNLRRPHLLTLPAEIRLTIFEYALKSQTRITVNHELNVPSLDRVCRQLRSEAIKVWLRVNKFDIVVDRFSPLYPSAWTRFETEHACKTRTTMTIKRSHNWTNLLAWANLVHTQQPVSVPGSSEHMDLNYAIANTVCGIAVGMVGKPWAECVEALEKFRRTLEKFDDGWV